MQFIKIEIVIIFNRINDPRRSNTIEFEIIVHEEHEIKLRETVIKVIRIEKV